MKRSTTPLFPQKKTLILLFSWFLLFFAHKLTAQQPERFTRLGIKDGLSQVSIYSVVQDKQGFMWFGTLNGLNRYDGRTVKTYRSNQHGIGLNSAYILSLLEDKSGVLWVGTMQGLHYYNTDNDDFHQINAPQLGHIYDIQHTKNGKLWLGCLNGLFLFNPETKKIEKKVIDDYVTTVLVTRSDEIWVGTMQEGIWVLNQKRQIKNRFKHSTSPNVLSHNRITKIYQSKDGTIRVGTEGGGMCEYVPETKEFVTYQYASDKKTVLFDVVWDILQVKNQIWLATTQGIFIYDAVSRNFIKQIVTDVKNSKSISDNHLLKLYEDRAGNVWIGTFKGGANMYNARGNIFHLISHNRGGQEILNQNGVMGIYEEAGKMWFSIDGGGLNVYDSASEKMKYYRHDSSDKQSISSDAVLSVYKDSEETYWIGTWGGGLNRFDPETETFEHFQHDSNEPTSLPSNNVWRTFEDSRGNFWIIMNEKGVVLFDRKTGKVTRQIIPKNDKVTMSGFFNIYEDSHANIYLSGWKGLVRYNLDADEYKIYSSYEKATPQSLPGEYPFCVFEDSQKRIWVGTSSGLAQFNLENETFTTYGVKEGLIHPEVVGILEDERGFLWLSTKQGLSRFDTENQSFMSFSMSDLSQEGEFSIGSYWQLQNRDLLFGSSSGITRLTPSDITLNLTVPPIFFTDFQLFNKSITPQSPSSPLSKSITETTQIILNHLQSVFTIDFVALSYVDAEKNRYKYKLEGFDDEWRDGSRQTATYTNLDAGTYTFRVIASNNHGIWNNTGKSLVIKILAPWWNTIPARVAFAMLIITVFAGFTRYRSWKFEKSQLKLKELVDDRTAQLEEKQEEVIERNQKLQQHQEALNQANEALERQHKKTTDSIRYAQTIQTAVLPSSTTMQKHHRNHFVIYKPKDIVAGDFYWVGKMENWTFTAVVDCTGHGVPGAFMSMIGSALFSEIILEKQILSPAKILEELNRNIQKALKQGETDNMDGMDLTLCATQIFDKERFKLIFCGAKSSLYYFSENTLHEIKGSRKAIGGKQYANKKFENQEFILNRDTVLYLTTDGIIDQNDPEREKFGKPRFMKLLTKIGHLPLKIQKEVIEQRLNQHQKDAEQRDDITLLAVSV